MTSLAVLWSVAALGLTNDPAPAADGARPDALPPAPAPPAALPAISDDLAGSFPGSFLVPGTDLSLAIGGRIKFDAIQDFDAIGSTDDFKTSTIPVPEVSSNGNTSFHARDTRLHLEARTPSEVGELRGFVEGNFFGSGDSFELRHAYVESDRFLAGQTWTNFMRIESRPETLDFEGPDGSVFLRQAQARWTQPVGDGLLWTLALEDPGSDVSGPATATPEQSLPDFTTGLHKDWDRGHVYLSGVLRQIAYDGAGDDEVVGWGASLSGRLPVGERDDFRFQAAYGSGIARYIEDLRGLGLDAALDGSGDLEALPTYGGFVAYRHHWSDSLRSNAMYSTTGVDNSAGQPPTALARTSYASVNLIWAAAERLDVGVEYLFGVRENESGADADANRIQFSVTYTL